MNRLSRFLLLLLPFSPTDEESAPLHSDEDPDFFLFLFRLSTTPDDGEVFGFVVVVVPFVAADEDEGLLLLH